MRVLFCVWLLCLFAVAALAQPHLPPAPVVGQLQRPRAGAAAVVVGGQIYVVGGLTRNEVTPSIERIDPQTGGGVIFDPNIKSRYDACAESYGPFIFLFGGFDETDRRTHKVERFDTRTREIERMVPLPVLRMRASSAVVGNQIYLVGGTDENDKSCADLWIYSIRENAWRAGAPMPTPRTCDLIARGNTLYAVGGLADKGASRDFVAYDIATNGWRALPPLPFALRAHRGALINDTMWFFGDYQQLDLVCAYDFGAGEWRRIENSGYTPRRYATVIAANGLVWIFGGNLNRWESSAQYVVERFNPTTERIVPFY